MSKRITFLFLMLILPFVATSIAQVPVGGSVDVALTTTYNIPAGLGGVPLTDATNYDFYVLNQAGDAVIAGPVVFTYNDGAGNVIPAQTIANYTDYHWGAWSNTVDPLANAALYGPFAFTTIGPTITLTGGGGSIAENGGSVVLTATAGAAIGKNLDISVTYSGTAATNGSDYSNSGATYPTEIITIAFGSGTGTTTVTAVSDRLLEGDEDLTATINASSSYVVGGSAQTVTITDDEFVILAATDISISENGGTSDITAEVSGTGSVGSFSNELGGVITVTLDWTLGSPTATNLVDYTRSAENLSIPANASSSAATMVTSLEDNFNEASETVVATITATTLGAAIGVTDAQTITIVENNVGLSIQPTFEWTNPGGGPNYTLQISTGSGGSFAVNVVYTYVGIATTSFDMSTTADMLLNNTKYYWQVTDNGLNATPEAEFRTAQNVTPFLTSPIAAQQVTSPTVQLYWNTSGHVGDFYYDIYYSQTQKSTYAGDTPNLQDLDNEVAFVTGLTPGVTYYWQVRVKNAAGNILGYSVVESFTTYGVLTEPLPLYPQNGSETYTTEPYVYWTSYFYSTIIQYKVRYSTVDDAADSSPSDGFLDDSALETPLSHDLYTQLLDLDPGQTYYWQVAATNDGGVTYVWSDIFDFITPSTGGSGSLVPPTPSYPTGGISVYSSSVTFYWQTGNFDNTLQYELRYSKDDNTTDGNGMLTAGTSLPLTSSNFRQVAGIDGDATYYWQVRTYNGSSFSGWSVVDNFLTDEAVLNVQTPILLTPYDGGFVTTLTPTLYWYVTGNPNGYNYTVVYNDDGAQDVSGNLSGTSNVLGAGTTDGYYAQFASSLNDGDTYYWQVIGVKGSVTKYSAIRSFIVNTINSVNAGPEIPIPTYPVGGFTVLTADPVLNWVMNGTYSHLEFQVQYSTNNSNTDGVLDAGVLTTAWTSNLSIALNSLTPGAVYYWQVRSRLSATPATVSDFSSIQYFVVSGGAGPSMAILGSPVNNTRIASTQPVLSWIIPSESTSELTYEVEIAEDAAMTSAQVIENVTTNNVKANLSAGKTYYWRVRSKTAEGEYSNYTGAGEFEIDGSITDVEDEAELPTEFKVSQNYPNPFNPSTTIKFALPANEKVSVKIYDMLGREIHTLLNSDLQAGNHQVVWNGNNSNGNKVSTGIYFYQVVAGNNVVTKKMILMK